MRVLHAGCGATTLPPDFPEMGRIETRLDIDPATRPDIVACMTDIGNAGPFDSVVCIHALEHLYPHDVSAALREFVRVLEPGGKAIVLVPDLEDARPTDEVLFVSPAGPICGLDLYYGHRASLKEIPYMAHRCGFVSDTLKAAMERAGFDVIVLERQSSFNLLAVGQKP